MHPWCEKLGILHAKGAEPHFPCPFGRMFGNVPLMYDLLSSWRCRIVLPVRLWGFRSIGDLRGNVNFVPSRRHLSGAWASLPSWEEVRDMSRAYSCSQEIEPNGTVFPWRLKGANRYWGLRPPVWLFLGRNLQAAAGFFT
jgi:hypothetical protein